MRFLAVLLMLVSPAVAQISGPDKVQTGQLVVREVQPQDGVSVSWMVAEPVDLTFRVFEGGNAVAFASGCAPHRVVLIMTAVKWDDKKITQERVIIDVVSPTPPNPPPDPPNPPNPPNPPPDPPGPIPDDQFGNVGKQAFQWAMSFDAAAKAAAPKVAANYLQVSQGLQTGSILTIEAGIQQIMSLNGNVLSQDSVRKQYSDWQVKINEVWQKHQPMTKYKIAAFFAAMHAALSQVK